MKGQYSIGGQRGGVRWIGPKNTCAAGSAVEPIESARHRANPQYSGAVTQQRHYPIVAEPYRWSALARITPFPTGSQVNFHEPGTNRSHPRFSRIVIRERAHRRAAESWTAVMPEPPAIRIPVTRPAGPRTDPQNAAAILVKSHGVAISQTARIACVAAVVRECPGGRLEQVQTLGGPRPQALHIVFENGPDMIIAERVTVVAVVLERGPPPGPWVAPVEPSCKRTDPERSGMILPDRAHPHGGE